MLVSDMAGRASIELKSQALGVDLGGDKELIGRIVDRVKEMESRGFTFEAADASFELLVHEEMSGKRPAFFTINHWVTSVERAADESIITKAEVTVTASGQQITCKGKETVLLTPLIMRCVPDYSSCIQNFLPSNLPITRFASLKVV